MRALYFSAILLIGSVALGATPKSSAQTDAELERRLEQELRSLSTAAADTFALANRARETERHEEAVALFHRVTILAPGFSHAWRREGYEWLLLDRRPDAVSRMRTAMKLEPSALNMLGLATALAAPSEDRVPAKGDLVEAIGLVRRGEQLDSTSVGLAFLASQLAISQNDATWLGYEAARIERFDASNPWGPAFAAIHFAMTGDLAAANRRLARARALGLPERTYQALHKGMNPVSPVTRLARVGGVILGGWLAGLAILLVLGSFLSRATLAASRRVPTMESGSALGMDATLRKAYRWVLGACCAYYCISMPIVFATVLLVGAGLVYLMLLVGHIPIKLLAIVVLLTLVTLWAILKSIFIRGRDEDPGLMMKSGEHPRLRTVLDEVAGKIGTRTVTNVYLTPGTDLAVMERGGVLKQFRGQTERCLILGVGGLEGMRMRPFRAILAHEYGHFSNRDTAGGGFALAVRRSLMTTAVNLARGGAASWYNPAWLFVNGFYRIFLRVSHGASRLQEVLADRWAAFTYGSRAFAEGLRHVIGRSVRFDAHVSSVLKEVIEGNKSLVNLYAYRPTTLVTDEMTLAGAVEEQIQRPPSPYDSHPRPADRMAWVEALGSTGPPEEDDDNDEVWSLFDDRDSVERRLTQDVRENISAAHGIELAPAAPQAPP
jgi:Zn-dependent protease with chaperone function